MLVTISTAVAGMPGVLCRTMHYLYHFIRHKKYRAEQELKGRLLRPDGVRDGRPGRITSDAVLLLYSVFESLLRFLIILLYPQHNAYRILYHDKHHTGHTDVIPTPQEFSRSARTTRLFTAAGGFVIVGSSILVGLALNIVTGVYKSAEAATFGWTQTNWNTLTTNTTGHPAPADWTQFSATTTNITVGATVQLTTTPLSQTPDTTDADFAQGTVAQTQTNGTGVSASLRLLPVTYAFSVPTTTITTYLDQNGAPGLGIATSTPQIFYMTSAGNSSFATLRALDNPTKISDYAFPAFGPTAYYQAPIAYGPTSKPSLLAYNGGGGMKFASCDSFQCSSRTVNTFTGSGNPPGPADLVLGTDGNGRLVYYNGLNRLAYGKCLNPACSSITTNSITTNISSPLSAIALGSDGYPRIFISLSSTGGLSYLLTCLDGNCDTTATTTIFQSNTRVGALAVNSVGIPYVAAGFVDAGGYRLDLLRCLDTSCSSFASTTLFASTTYSITGRDRVGIKIDSSGKPKVLLYLNPGSSVYLYAFRCQDAACSSATTENIESGATAASAVNHLAFNLSPDGLGAILYSKSGGMYYRYEYIQYAPSGTFTSRAIDIGFAPPSWGNLSWTQGGSGTITMKARSDADGDFSNAPAWGTCSNIANGGSITVGGCATNGHRYIQYQASLSTSDTALSPTLDDVTVGYNGYAAAQTITSSAFDTGSAENLMGGAVWTEDAALPAGAQTGIALRSASTSADLSSAAWSEVSATSTGCSKSGQAVTCTAAAFPAAMSDGVADRWFQYRLRLSSNGAGTPTVDAVTVRYVFNAAPSLQNVSASEQPDGSVQISYEVQDVDTTTGSVTPGFVNPSFEYSTNGGGSWTPITLGLPSSATSTKAVSESSWTPYTVMWNARAMLSGLYTPTAKIRVTANDNEAASNLTQLASLDFALDLKPPAPGIVPVKVNGQTNPALITLSATDDNPVSMKVSRLPSLSDASWAPYAPSATLQLVSEPDTVYVLFKDNFENISATSSATTPATPANIIIRDLSNITASPNENRLFVAWGVINAPGPGFAFYRVERSTDGTTYSPFASIPTRTTNYVIDDNSSTWLDPGTTYSYRLYSEDANGNTSYYSAAVSDKPDGQGGTDLTPPAISAVVASSSAQTATFTWATDELSDSLVGYCLSPCTSPETTQGVSSFVTAHTVAVSGLAPGTTYLYSIYSRDPSGNSASSTGYSFTTGSGPAITNVAVARTSNTDAKIVWTTDIPSSSFVIYATNTPPTGGVESITGLASQTTTHEVTVSGLESGKTYYFYVTSQDALGNWSFDERIVSGVKEYYTFSTTNDSTAPVVSAVSAASVWDTSATITWSTDELADSFIEWSTVSGTYATSTARATLDMVHYLDLSGLTSLTTYYYRVRSADASGNVATSSEYSFTTLEEQIGISQRVNVTHTVAVPVDTGTTVIGIAKEEYDRVKSELDKALASLASALKELNEIKKDVLGITEDKPLTPKEILKSVTDKFASLTDLLRKNTTLSLSGEDLAPAVETLRELAERTPPPIVLGSPEVTVYGDHIEIVWNTDVETNGVIAYARDDEYVTGNADPYVTETGEFDTYATAHKVTLSNLSPATRYHFQIRTRTKIGSYSKTRDYLFTTKTQLPKIFDAHRTKLDDRRVEIIWQTNIPANSSVRYTPEKNGIVDEKASRIFGSPEFVTRHRVALDNLDAGTAYQMRVISSDQFGNAAEEDLAAILTGKDIIPPIISDLRSEVTVFPGVEQKIQAIIFWTTDEASDGQVYYEEGVSGGDREMPRFATKRQEEFSTAHTVVVGGWKANTVYRVRVMSSDTSGNSVISKDYAVRTPAQKASIIDVITSGFSDTFGWTKRIRI